MADDELCSEEALSDNDIFVNVAHNNNSEESEEQEIVPLLQKKLWMQYDWYQATLDATILSLNCNEK